jgi:hypothetical protein
MFTERVSRDLLLTELEDAHCRVAELELLDVHVPTGEAVVNERWSQVQDCS